MVATLLFSQDDTDKEVKEDVSQDNSVMLVDDRNLSS